MKEYKFKINGKEYNVAIGEAEGKMLSVNVNGADYQVELENAPAAPPVQAAPAAPQPSASGLREGAVIEHQRFGIGTIVRLEGSGDNEKATVDFRNAGTKQLLLKFARFKVVTP